MKKPFVIFSITVLFSLFLITCAKEYSYEGGPQAEYTIEGSPAECAPVVLSGTYTEGITVDSSNNLQVTVDVTLAGGYNIFTTPVNGISFSATGNFTDTGKQVVTLACTGTPAAVGSFVIKIPGDKGCDFSLNVKNKISSSYFLSGYPNDCENPGIGGRYAVNDKITNGDTITLHVTVITPGTYNIQTDTVNGISFSASGYFSLMGNQTVKLTCSGLPDSAGRVFFNVHADSSQCKFSIPIESGSPQAVYVLESGTSGGSLYCTPQLVNGTYFSGVSLNNTNTVNITAYVTVIGTYSIYTTKINGMMFGNSGTFTAIGRQTVVLSGSGTPLTAGTFTFAPNIIGPAPIGGSSCGFDINVQ
ncbi:hypothetical protein FW778_17290 [Ginsengibacter hankyongi]|uniref:Uncharacterized protein n=1 Tax=Ginsengibacter hankyongi TaxID=2607284 RepID=A0A5J5IHF6_9BACT|nr:hypothetical protein [Ginsengibacter hankyongi]KAA9037182.1 hypothetical protein FW778_17290 [Ginsengibacter hankyongi]